MQRSSAPLVGWILLIAAIAGTVVLGTLPAPYVIESPGPVYDTIGDIELAGEDEPVIEITGEKTYPTSGSLDMLTVHLTGSRERPISWVNLALAWFDPTRGVLPIDAVYPNGQTEQQSDEESAADMADSQQEAAAAALTELGIPFTSTVTVAAVLDGFPADGVLEKGDRILTVDGDAVNGVTELSAALRDRPVGSTFQLGIEREGKPLTVEVTTAPSPDDPDLAIVGIQTGVDYDFPFQVTVNLGDVGGPSAGMMLALGVYDKLTPGELTGGEEIAGTGTIAADGRVGPIGGIRQKMYGAQQAGADWFLAPVDNCGEVVGHVPAGLEVFAVSSLEQALETVETIADDGDVTALPRCD